MDFFILILFALLLITAVGHGIWVGIAALFRQFNDKPRAARFAEFCPRCESRLNGSQCVVCGWPNSLPAANREPAALNATRSQLERFRRMGLIEEATYQRLFAALETQLGAAAAPFAAVEVASGAPETAIPLVAAAPIGGVPPAEPEPADRDEAADETAAEAMTLPPLAPRAASTVAERARAFESSRAAATAQEGEPAAVSAARSAGRRPFAEVLLAFMEDRNIRWGELVGGLLIIGCSIALVISFWAQISERPVLKFLVFNGTTAALFGLGYQAAHRWRLRTTGHGVLLIATLLVPLNFLAIAAFTRAEDAGNLLTLGGELFSIGLFTTLTFYAGKVLAPARAAVFALAVLGPSVLQLSIRRWVGPTTGEGLVYLFGGLAEFLFAIVNLWPRKSIAANHDSTVEASRGWTLLGVSGFATVLALGLLLVKAGQPWYRLHDVTVLLGGFGLTPLVAGLRWFKMAAGPEKGRLRLVGLSIAVAGAALLIASVAWAWPVPAHLLPAAAFVFVILTAVALWCDLPEAHGPAVAALAVAVLAAWHLAGGTLAWQTTDASRTWHALLSATSGHALLLLSLAAAAAGVAWARGRRPRDASAYAWAAGALFCAGLALASYYGLAQAGDPYYLTPIYALLGFVAWIGLERSRNQRFAPLALAAWLVASVQGVVYLLRPAAYFVLPWVVALQLYATLVLGMWGLSCWRSRLERRDASERRRDSRIWMFSVLTATGGSAVWLLFKLPEISYGASALHWLWGAALCGGMVLFEGEPLVFVGFQATLSLAALLAVANYLAQRAWFVAAPLRWFDPRTWQAEGIALAALGIAWSAVRWGLRQHAARGGLDQLETTRRWDRLLNPAWMPVDRLLVRFSLFAGVMLSLYAVWPGLASELSPMRLAPTAFEIPGLAHSNASGHGSVLLLAVVFAALLFEIGQRRSLPIAVWLMPLIWSSALLVAAQGETRQTVASATPATLTLFLIAGTALIWFREPLRRWRPWREWDSAPAAPATAVRALPAVLAAALALSAAASCASCARAAADGAGGRGFGLSDFHGGVLSSLMIGLVCCWILGLVLNASSVVSGSTRSNSKSDGSKESGSAIRFWSGFHLLDVYRFGLVLLGAGPILAIAAWVAGVATVDPLASSLLVHPIFPHLTWAAAFGLPVALAALALLAQAVRERSESLALVAGLVGNLALTTMSLLAWNESQRAFGFESLRQLAQWNAIFSALYALAWLACEWRFGSGRNDASQRKPLSFRRPLTVQLLIPLALNAILLWPAWLYLCLWPTSTTAWVAAGDASGWGALALGLLAVGIGLARTERRSLPSFGWFGGTLFAALAACWACRWDHGNWLGLHVLLGGQLAVAWVLAIIGALWGQGDSRRARERGSFFNASVISAWLALSLGLRALAGDPAAPRSTLTALIVLALLAIWIACFARRRELLSTAALAINGASSVAGLHSLAWSGSFSDALSNLFAINVVALALPVPLWLWIELRLFRAQVVSEDSAATDVPRAARRVTLLDPLGSIGVLSLHRSVTRAALFSLVALVGLHLAGAVYELHPAGSRSWDWLAIGSTAVAAVACLWDALAVDAVAALYFLGLIVCGGMLEQSAAGFKQIWWFGNTLLAAYALLTSYLWSCRAGLRGLARRLRIPPRSAGPWRGDGGSLAAAEFGGLAWLTSFNAILIAVVVGLSFAIELNFAELPLRVLAAKCVLVQMATLGLLARGQRRSALQFAALAVGVLGAVALSWSFLTPGEPGDLIQRAVLVTLALSCMAVLYGLGLAKWLAEQSEWLRAAERVLPAILVCGACSILTVLGYEALRTFQMEPLEIAPWAIGSFALVLVALAALALVAALLPGRDPFQLSERGRMSYVYGAEVLLGLAFFHLRLTMPWLFQGYLAHYWPLVVMALAFVWVGVGESLRNRWRVLGEPLETTGAMLPLAPVAGFWFLPAGVDYSLLLLAVSLLYVGLATARRSLLYGMLAVAAANGGLWYFLSHQPSFGIAEHPQLWLIPPALCVLIAAQLLRRQLPAAQLAAIRLAAASVAYVSSTADVFIQGVAHAPWLPAVLAGLSLLGVAAGIVLRVRAYLILGASFLLLAILTVIYYAAVDLQQTWLWAVTGIVTGIAILVAFALFEKQREKIQGVMEKLKEWQ
ncbi:MAG TPA: hypothetical protein VFE24_11785 [Pirellulales bacterium]|jgi:hypothetical protein|nr:hypothetical protein [Pirellulales bacterium]